MTSTVIILTGGDWSGLALMSKPRDVGGPNLPPYLFMANKVEGGSRLRLDVYEYIRSGSGGESYKYLCTQVMESKSKNGQNKETPTWQK
jgi:hypothetical protein